MIISTDQELKIITPRDNVEKALIGTFSGRLLPVAEKIAAYMPEPGRDDILSKSSNFPHGLVYKDENATFGVGVFFRRDKKMVPSIYILSPQGRNWNQSVDSFSKKILEVMPEAEIIVRHPSSNPAAGMRQKKYSGQ